MNRLPVIWTRPEIRDWLHTTRLRYGRPMSPREVQSWEENALREALSFRDGEYKEIDDTTIEATMLLIHEVVRTSYVYFEYDEHDDEGE